MKREDQLTQYLEEIQRGAWPIGEALARHPVLQGDLEPLVRVHFQLEALPQNIVLPETAKVRMRAQLLAEARQAPPRCQLAAWWEGLREEGRKLLALRNVGHLLARPAGVALSILLGVSLVGVGTVSAAMESVPGDGLYPMKLATEQTRLALSFTEREKVETYLWIASSRVEELSKISEAGKYQHAAQVVLDYQHSVAQALRLSAAQKEEEDKLSRQVARVQTSLQELYEKAPQSLQAMLAQTLTLASTSSSQAQTGPAAIPESSGAPSVVIPPASELSTGGTGAPNAPSPNGLPSGNPLPRDKSDVTPEPPPPKSGPLSSPPPQPSPGVEPKGNIGPPPAPAKNDPPASSPSTASPSGALAPKEDPTGVQGSTGLGGKAP